MKNLLLNRPVKNEYNTFLLIKQVNSFLLSNSKIKKIFSKRLFALNNIEQRGTKRSSIALGIALGGYFYV